MEKTVWSCSLSMSSSPRGRVRGGFAFRRRGPSRFFGRLPVSLFRDCLSSDRSNSGRCLAVTAEVGIRNSRGDAIGRNLLDRAPAEHIRWRQSGQRLHRRIQCRIRFVTSHGWRETESAAAGGFRCRIISGIIVKLGKHHCVVEPQWLSLSAASASEQGRRCHPSLCQTLLSSFGFRS